MESQEFKTDFEKLKFLLNLVRQVNLYHRKVMVIQKLQEVAAYAHFFEYDFDHWQETGMWRKYSDFPLKTHKMETHKTETDKTETDKTETVETETDKTETVETETVETETVETETVETETVETETDKTETDKTEIKQTNGKSCDFCGEEFFTNKSAQRFCADKAKNCKNNYHNANK